jgi:hypothetical protein
VRRHQYLLLHRGTIQFGCLHSTVGEGKVRE